MKLHSFIKGGLVCFTLLIIAFGGFIWRRSRLPALGEAPFIEFPATSAAHAEEFLDGNFSLITNVRNLPSPVLAAFTEQGGSRLVIANPGENFRATDVVYDATLPHKTPYPGRSIWQKGLCALRPGWHWPFACLSAIRDFVN